MPSTVQGNGSICPDLRSYGYSTFKGSAMLSFGSSQSEANPAHRPLPSSMVILATSL